MTSEAATILVVEDNQASRDLLVRFVAALGHKVLSVGDGLSALEVARAQSPDLILLDVIMPRMDGHEVLRRLKEDDKLRNVPIILISAVNEVSSVAMAIEHGADDYLLKPFNPTILRARVSACLEKKLFRDREQQLYLNLQSSYKKLREAEEARDALSSMIVHDLSSPLSVVLGRIEIMEKELAANQAVGLNLVENIRAIRRAAKEMSSLIRGILDVSKLEAGEMPVTLETINAVAFTRELYERFAQESEGSRAQLSFSAQAESLMVCADPDLLSRTLQNLIANALKHAGTAPIVTVSVKTCNRDVLISVRDNGPGIPAGCEEKIFEKFFQATVRKERKKYGVGLGLAFCKMAIEAQGGKIWAENAQGGGARFTVSLKAQET